MSFILIRDISMGILAIILLAGAVNDIPEGGGITLILGLAAIVFAAVCDIKYHGYQLEQFSQESSPAPNPQEEEETP